MNSTRREGRAAARKAVALALLVLTCLSFAGCGRSRDKAVDSAVESLSRGARSAAGAFAADLDARGGGSFEQSRPALLKVLADNSSAKGAVVEEAVVGAEWRTVVLYEAQRPYSRGFTSDELTVGGCVEYRVSVAALELLSAGATDCPQEVAARFDEAIRIDIQKP